MVKNKFGIAVLAICLICSVLSCSYMDGDVTEWEAKEVIMKVREHLDFFYSQHYDEYKAGAVITDIDTPPNMKEKKMESTVESYSITDYKISYKEKVKFDNWSGDGSLPYMNIYGTITHEYNDYSHTINGTLKLLNCDNNVDNITMDIVIDSAGQITGTVKADAQEFTW